MPNSARIAPFKVCFQISTDIQSYLTSIKVRRKKRWYTNSKMYVGKTCRAKM